jgi:hypothetical protein
MVRPFRFPPLLASKDQTRDLQGGGEEDATPPSRRSIPQSGYINIPESGTSGSHPTSAGEATGGGGGRVEAVELGRPLDEKKFILFGWLDLRVGVLLALVAQVMCC